MFYVKSQLDESTTLLTEITDENVFTRCPDCGQEVSVDLNDVIDDEGQLICSAWASAARNAAASAGTPPATAPGTKEACENEAADPYG